MDQSRLGRLHSILTSVKDPNDSSRWAVWIDGQWLFLRDFLGTQNMALQQGTIRHFRNAMRRGFSAWVDGVFERADWHDWGEFEERMDERDRNQGR